MLHIDLNKFTKIDELTSPEQMPPESLTELINMTLDKELGKAKIRSGITRYSTPQVDASGSIHSLFDIKDSDDNNYLLAGIGTKLRKSQYSSGWGSWSDIRTGLTNAKLRMTPYGDKFYLTNGYEAPFYTDLTDYFSLNISPPDTSSITVTNNNPGATTYVWRQYILVYVLDDGQLSGASDSVGYFDSADSADPDITLSNLPVSASSRVVGRMLFGTKWGDMTNYYLVASLDNTVTSFRDTIKDDLLDTSTQPTYLNLPQTAKYICPNSDTLFMANITKLQTNRVLPPCRFINWLPGHTVDDSTAGNLTNGTYKWARSLVDLKDNESALVEIFEYALLTTGKQISVTIPYDAVKSFASFTDQSTYLINAGIKSIRYYRTKVNGSTYYFHSDIKPQDNVNLIGAFTDNTADADLGVVYPISSHDPTEVTNLPSTIVYSDLYQPGTFRETSLNEVYPDDTDKITGIFDDDNGIMVFKEKSICKLYTNGAPDNWESKKISENIGCNEPDSIYKIGQTYYFVFRGKPYSFSGMGEPKEIGMFFNQTFSSVSSILSATYDTKKNWYILAVKISTNYYLLIYDAKLETWYKFIIKQADSIITKGFGTDVGKIIIGDYDSYLAYYNDSAQQDNDSGSTTDIVISLITKTFNFLDDFVIARLRYWFLNYLRFDGSSLGSAVFQIYDVDNETYLTYGDSDGGNSLRITKLDTDTLGDVKTPRRLNIQIRGSALGELYSMRIDYEPLKEGYAR